MARGRTQQGGDDLEAWLAAVEGGGPVEQRAAMDALEALPPGEARRAAADALDARLRGASATAELPLAVALARLGEGGDAVVDALMARLGAPHPDHRWAARKALVRIGGDAVAVAVALADRARRGASLERCMALGALAELGWPAAAGEAPALLAAALEDPDAALRVAALTLLVRGAPGGAGLASAVRACLAGDPAPEVRRVAAVALGEVGARSDRALLERAAADADRGLATAARRASSRLAARAI